MSQQEVPPLEKKGIYAFLRQKQHVYLHLLLYVHSSSKFCPKIGLRCVLIQSSNDLLTQPDPTCSYRSYNTIKIDYVFKLEYTSFSMQTLVHTKKSSDVICCCWKSLCKIQSAVCHVILEGMCHVTVNNMMHMHNLDKQHIVLSTQSLDHKKLSSQSSKCAQHDERISFS